jgi:hypothetical protein
MSQYNYTEEQSYQKINNFFAKEIQNLKVPVIDNRPNRVSVGPYRVITNGKLYEIWKGSQHLYDFLRRSWGVGYALSLYQNNSLCTQKLLEYNSLYSRLAEKRFMYNYHLNIAQRRKDAGKQDIFWCRLSRVESEISSLEYKTNTILKSIQLR